MRKLRIVFMGTPDFAVATLQAIVDSEHEVVGVITAADKPAGRGRKLQESAVKRFAQAAHIPVLQPTNLKAPDFIESLAALEANLQVVVAFRMLPKVVWDMPQFGTFNLHASLLPNYRGAAPINWAIINGEEETGVTTFFIDDKIDTGEIILQKKTTIANTDTAGTLHDSLMVLGAKLVLETLALIANNTVVRIKQTEEKTLKSAYKIHKDTCRIPWDKPIAVIYNHIRGLSPYPSAWTTLVINEERIFLKIYAATIILSEHHLDIGTIVHTKKELHVAVKGGFINLLEIQLPGKRKMKTSEVLNGLKLSKTTRVF